MKKYILNILSVLAVILLFAHPANAQQTPFENFAVKYTLDNGFEYEVRAFTKIYSDPSANEVLAGALIGSEEIEKTDTNDFALVMPYGTQGKSVTFVVPEGVSMSLDGEMISDGAQRVLTEGTYSVVWNNEEWLLYVMYTSDIPQVYITTPEGGLERVHEDKYYKEPGCEITITDGNTTEYSGELEYLKGRGNSTWNKNKKPYNIKLDKKANLFDMGISKKYSLIANYSDKTFIKNKLGMDFADYIGIDYNLQSQHVDLFINGEYMGNYLLTERVEVDTYRVNIFSLEDINRAANPGEDLSKSLVRGDDGKSAFRHPGSCKWVEMPNVIPGKLNGGYLLELQMGFRYYGERSGFVSDYGQPVVICGPENASQLQVEYIKNYYCEFEQAVLSDDGYNSKGKHYSDYIDVESMAQMYLMQEFIQNYDAGLASFYLYKDIGGKLTACTVWDMDIAFGKEYVLGGYNLSSPDNILLMDNRMADTELSHLKRIFTLLCQHSDFRHRIAQLWEQKFEADTEYFYPLIDEIYAGVKDSAKANLYKWDNASGTPESAEKHYDEYVEKLRGYIEARKEFLSDYFDAGDIYLQYSANGGTGVMIEKAGFGAGENATAKENKFINGDAQFLGWNTEKDGSGTAYMPGDTVDMSGGDTVLYAQWDGADSLQSGEVSAQPQSGIFAAVINWFKNLFN